MTALGGNQLPERSALESWGTDLDTAELPEMASPPRHSVESAISSSLASSQDSPVTTRTRRFSTGMSPDWESYTPLGQGRTSTSSDLGDWELFDWSNSLADGLQSPRTPNAPGPRLIPRDRQPRVQQSEASRTQRGLRQLAFGGQAVRPRKSRKPRFGGQDTVSDPWIANWRPKARRDSVCETASDSASYASRFARTGGKAAAVSADPKPPAPKAQPAKTRVPKSRQTPAAKEGSPAAEDDASPKKKGLGKLQELRDRRRGPPCPTAANVGEGRAQGAAGYIGSCAAVSAEALEAESGAACPRQPTMAAAEPSTSEASTAPLEAPRPPRGLISKRLGRIRLRRSSSDVPVSEEGAPGGGRSPPGHPGSAMAPSVRIPEVARSRTAGGTARQALVPCPRCGRRFNENAAERHIPRHSPILCKEKVHRPSRLAASSGRAAHMRRS